MRFNVPPGWPPPPPGWVPPPGFRPDPSWPPVPLDWLWWIPVTSGDTAVLRPPPAPGIGTGSSPGRPRSWIARHTGLTIALAVLLVFILGGAATAGVVFIKRASDKSVVADARSPSPQPASAAPQASPSPDVGSSSDPNSPQNKAACGKAADAHAKAVALVRDYSSGRRSKAELIAAAPPVQAGLAAASGAASGELQRDLREYAAAVGSFRTSLLQNRNPSTAAAKVLILSIVLKADCGF